jgi:hypothetical protein
MAPHTYIIIAPSPLCTQNILAFFLLSRLTLPSFLSIGAFTPPNLSLIQGGNGETDRDQFSYLDEPCFASTVETGRSRDRIRGRNSGWQIFFHASPRKICMGRNLPHLVAQFCFHSRPLGRSHQLAWVQRILPCFSSVRFSSDSAV